MSMQQQLLITAGNIVNIYCKQSETHVGLNQTKAQCGVEYNVTLGYIKDSIVFGYIHFGSRAACASVFAPKVTAAKRSRRVNAV